MNEKKIHFHSNFVLFSAESRYLECLKEIISRKRSLERERERRKKFFCKQQTLQTVIIQFFDVFLVADAALNQ